MHRFPRVPTDVFKTLSFSFLRLRIGFQMSSEQLSFRSKGASWSIAINSCDANMTAVNVVGFVYAESQ